MSDDRYVWMNARYRGRCHECRRAIATGERMLYDALDRVAYCEEHGEEIQPGVVK